MSSQQVDGGGAQGPGAGSRFDGRVAVVTGASRGIGLAIARRLVAEGARVCLTARGEPELTAAAESLGRGEDGAALAIAVPGKADDVQHQQLALCTTVDTFGRLDVLVNNTGINPVYGATVDVQQQAAAKILGVNVLAALSWVEQAVAAGLGSADPADGAAVVNVASVAGLRPAPGLGMYGVSKAALIQLTAQLAVELGPRIRVNAVAPAVVRTRFAEALYEGREDQVSALYPMRRLGEPEDVAAAVAFLAGPDAAWVTGQTLVVDGGLLLRGGV